MKKAYKLVPIILGITVGFFAIAYMLSSWATYTQEYGPSVVKFGGTVYTQGMGSVGSRLLPDGFVSAGEVKRVRHSAADVTRDLDGYKLRRGYEIFANSDNPDTVYVFDRVTERYVLHTTEFLQRHLILVDGKLYSHSLIETSELVYAPPEGAEFLGRVSSTVMNAFPSEELQMNTDQTYFAECDVYRSSDGAAVYLLRSHYGKYLLYKFI